MLVPSTSREIRAKRKASIQDAKARRNPAGLFVFCEGSFLPDERADLA
jgi:hypothetical protein